MRWPVVLAAILLAGCSGAPPPAEDPATPGSPALDGAGLADGVAGNLSGDGAAPATDTLFLRPARLDAAGLANVTVLATLGGPQPQTLAWNATLNGTGNVSHARLRLWLDLQSSAVQAGVNGDPACTAMLTLLRVRNATQAAQAGGCASAGTGLIPAGEHLLDLGTPMTAFPTGLDLAPGDGLVVQVSFGLSFPQGQAFVLGGGDRASALRLTGLAEPMPAAAGNATTPA